jgi:hypothetical protein
VEQKGRSTEMKLKRPELSSNSASYQFTQASHRQGAVDGAIEIISRDTTQWIEMLSTGSPESAVTRTTDAWLVETLVQGAWIREYHEWAKATKDYFNEQHRLNGSPAPQWKNGKGWSHIDFVRERLEAFSINLSPHILFIIERNRDQISTARYDEGHLADEKQFREFHNAIADFWNELASAEGRLP